MSACFTFFKMLIVKRMTAMTTIVPPMGMKISACETPLIVKKSPPIMSGSPTLCSQKWNLANSVSAARGKST